MANLKSICPRCANFKPGAKCSYCNIDKISTTITTDEYFDMSSKERDEYVNHCIETLIKDTYDPEAAEYRKKNQYRRNNQKSVNLGKSGIVNQPKCPTCKSTNLKKISVTSKAVNTAVFGIFGTKRNKTFHCNNCGYEW